MDQENSSKETNSIEKDNKTIQIIQYIIFGLIFLVMIYVLIQLSLILIGTFDISAFVPF